MRKHLPSIATSPPPSSTRVLPWHFRRAPAGRGVGATAAPPTVMGKADLATWRSASCSGEESSGVWAAAASDAREDVGRRCVALEAVVVGGTAGTRFVSANKAAGRPWPRGPTRWGRHKPKSRESRGRAAVDWVSAPAAGFAAADETARAAVFADASVRFDGG